MSLHLCVDFRGLNSKTIPNRHPLPHIQDLLDKLGGNSWFSILDQGSAYHQSLVKEGCQNMTAFSTPWGSMSGYVSLLALPMHQQHFSAAWRAY